MARMTKPNPTPEVVRNIAADWAWAYPIYELSIPGDKKVVAVAIDPSGLMADIAPENNSYSVISSDVVNEAEKD